MKNTLLFFLSLSFLFSFAQEQRSTLKAGQAPFFHGVASGDPTADKVMLWTKVTPPVGNGADIEVYWQIATDLNFTNIVNFGKTKATAAADYTVKVDVCGLQGGTYYYYVFKALGQNSITGRTKTAPASGTAQAKFGIVSCSSYEHGYFNAYESLSKRNDLDAIIHLGDYIYEYASGGFSSTVVTGNGRIYQPTNEIITLSDYRIRHSHYKLDDQLQMLHQVHPFITTWDDHETANDSYKDGAENHTTSTEGPWINRKISGTQAYKEYMPIRNPDPNNDLKIWRKLRYGNLLDLIVLDSRLWGRDLQDMGQTNNTNHKLLGDDQFAWLETQLSDNSTQWKVICQQVMMAPLEILGNPVNADQWDGYNSDRNRLINYIENNSVQNPVVLTGDIHTTWINNVPGNNTTTAAVEFVVTSVTSPGLDVIETALGQLPSWLLNLFGGAVNGVITGLNPHMKYVNTEDHGYMVFSVNTSKAQGDYVWLEREVIDQTDEAGPSYYTNTGVSNMQSTNTAIPTAIGPPTPSQNANQNLPFALLLDTFQVNAEENIVNAACLLNVSSLCPNITTSILNPASFGTATINQFCWQYLGLNNFNGIDYFTVVFCQVANPSECDTTVVQVNINPESTIDTLHYSVTSDSTLNDCLSFNDLVGPISTLQVINNGTGSITVDNQNCFSYLSDLTFNGTDYISMVACDTLGFCDTIVLAIEVGALSSISYVELYGAPGDLLSSCLDFDELQGNIINTGMAYTGPNAAQQYNDTCISFLTNATFTGVDTLLLWGCDNSIPALCDTVIYYIIILDDTTGIRADLNSDFAVMGVYPNPFDVEILVQYYQFNSQEINIALYDITGKELFNENIGEKTQGLKYARLQTSELSKGTYVIELNSEKFKYSQQIVKH